MTHDNHVHHHYHREQIPSPLNDDDEGFFTASDSDSEKEDGCEEKTRPLINHFQLKLTNLTAQDANTSMDSPMSVYMEAPIEFDKTLKKLDEPDVSSPARRRKLFQQNKGLSFIGELESELSSLNHELENAIVEKKQNRPLQRTFSNLERLKKEMDELAKSVVVGSENNENGSSVVVHEVSKLKGLVAQVNTLKLNVNYLKPSSSVEESSVKSGAEIAALSGKVEELEKKLEDRDDEFCDAQSEMSSQIDSCDREIVRLREEKEGLMRKLSDRTQELNVERSRSKELIRELNVERERSKELISKLSDQICYLTKELNVENGRSKELISKLLDQEETISKLDEESNLVKGRFLQVADRKIEEVVEEFKKNFVDKLLILSQRIRVVEQLHVETKNNWQRTRDRCKQQHPDLEKRLEEFSKTSESSLWEMHDTIKDMMRRMEAVVGNLECKESNFADRISAVSEEIKMSKNWVRLVVEELKPSSTTTSTSENENIEEMEEKVQRLEGKVKKERGDKLRLMRGMYDLQHKVAELEKVISEKEEGLVRLTKEKVEAIRQLCVWIEYHQSRFDHLVVLVKRRNKSKGR